MAEKNVDIYKRSVAALSCGDWGAWAAGIDPDILVRTDPSWPEQRVYGREAVRAFLAGIREAWGGALHLEEVVDLGDRLLATFRWSVHAPTSGVEGEQHFSEIATFRDGRMILSEFFLEHEHAVEALQMRR